MNPAACRPAAVIFDFDGVLVDTEPLHYEAFQQVLAPLGLAFSWEQYAAEYMGYDDRDAIRVAFRAASREPREDLLPGLIEAKAKVFDELMRRKGARPYPGVLELIADLRDHCPLALCSGAYRRDLEPILSRLRLSDTFRVWVTADDVAASKPDPASYVLAVERLRQVTGRPLQASDCVAIEDTPAGIQAARGAGLRVLAVAHTHPAGRLIAADWVLETLAGVTWPDLQSLDNSSGKQATVAHEPSPTDRDRK